MQMQAVAVIFGLVLVAFILHEVFEVMLLPRRIRRRIRLIHSFFRLTWGLWTRTGNLIYERRREGFLSMYGPLSMVVLLIFWASGLIVGFGLMQWGVQHDVAHPPSLGNELYLSGSTFFTLGYGDVNPMNRTSKFLAIAEGGTGFGYIAVMIGYLPVLYQLFSRREAHVIQLDARAGSPPSALTLITRHAEMNAIGELNLVLREWEQWCAEILESHLSYPMLSYYRSQQDNQSWLAALAVLLDTCAILLTGVKDVLLFPARMCFAIARLATVELCRVFQLATPPPDTDRLTPLQFTILRDTMESVDLCFVDEPNAEERLRAFRSTYEPFLFALSKHFNLNLPPWLPEDSRDNWQISPRGLTAKQLVESAPMEEKQESGSKA